MPDKNSVADAQFIADYVFEEVPKMAARHQLTRRAKDGAPTLSFDPLELVEFLARFSVAYDAVRVERFRKENANGQDSSIQGNTNGPETD